MSESTSTTTEVQPPIESQELAKSKEPKTIIAMGDTGIRLGTFDDLARFSKVIYSSGFAPKGMNPEAIFVAIQMGLELGISPMAALQSIAVINGRPSLYGDMQLALVNASGLCEEFEEWFEDKSGRLARNPQDFTDDVAGVSCVKRKGRKQQEYSFSVADARRAKLWGKAGPWSEHPQRMLRFRARAFLLRDVFGDVLKGMKSAEEMGDEPVVTVRDVTTFGGAHHGKSLALEAVKEIAQDAGIEIQTIGPKDTPAVEPRPRGGKKAKPVEQETPPLPPDRPETEVELLHRLIKERGVSEVEIILAAKQAKLNPPATIAEFGPDLLSTIIDGIDDWCKWAQEKIRAKK